MGSLYRSEEMRLCQLILHKDAAFACVAELGRKALVQFKDMNPDVNAFQRTFVQDVRRCNEMERKLRFLESQIRKRDIKMSPIDDTNFDVSHPREMKNLQATLADLERDVNEMNESNVTLKKSYMELTELDQVLRKSEGFFEGGIDDAAMAEIEAVDEAEPVGLKMVKKYVLDKEATGFVVGVVRRDRSSAFERVLWRACRRTVFVRLAEIETPLEDPQTGERVEKCVFIIFYKGERLKNIVDKVCDGFKARQYACPKTSKERLEAAAGVETRLEDLRVVMGTTDEHQVRVLHATAINVKQWLKDVRLQKAVYHTLDLFSFDAKGQFFIAECWCAVADVDEVQQAIDRGVAKSGATVRPILNRLESSEQPPTYNRVNKFTRVFQSIVDSYGIATYREVNPAPYTIITFPFLFAIMFGDCCHGLLMFLSGLYLVLREKNLEARHIRDEIFNMFFGGRYVILLMGLFSMYTGTIYNDAFAKSVNVFGSAWRNPFPTQELDKWARTAHEAKKELFLDLPPEYAYQRDIGPYPYGVDPIWNLAENRLNFLNSMKMKTSVIIGIAQMAFGVVLSLLNYRFFKSNIDVFTVFIPQMLFLGCIFIYLCLQIIIKWIYFWVEPEVVFGQLYPGSHCAPSLLIGLINMFMFKSRNAGFIDTSLPAKNDSSGRIQYAEQPSCYLSQWYPGQSTVEAILVLIAIICIPIMLFGKPIYLKMKQRKSKHTVVPNMSVRANVHTEETVIMGNDEHAEEIENHVESSASTPGHHEENFTDIMVHQSIHTIEYVLGCVSHTASYLRLWALSLAHAQLSEVLWRMVLVQAFALDGIASYIAVYVIFFIFGVLTISILVLMEGLSAFLHALRLHWVEFQSKFYGGLGYAFMPLSFADVIEKARVADG